MTRDEAQANVARDWQPIAEQAFGTPTRIDTSAIEEYEWGWVFSCVPIDLAKTEHLFPRRRYAVDRETGIVTPVGTKGLAEALEYLMKWRQKRMEAASIEGSDQQ